MSVVDNLKIITEETHLINQPSNSKDKKEAYSIRSFHLIIQQNGQVPCSRHLRCFQIPLPQLLIIKKEKKTTATK